MVGGTRREVNATFGEALLLFAFVVAQNQIGGWATSVVGEYNLAKVLKSWHSITGGTPLLALFEKWPTANLGRRGNCSSAQILVTSPSPAVRDCGECSAVFPPACESRREATSRKAREVAHPHFFFRHAVTRQPHLSAPRLMWPIKEMTISAGFVTIKFQIL